jgi:hypothetical protein
VLCYWATLSASLFVTGTSYSDPIEPEQRCATTPTYKYFEDIQYDAYTETNPLYYNLLTETRDQRKLVQGLKDTGEELNKRNNSLDSSALSSRNGKPSVDGGMSVILQDIKEFPLPTCYENPLTYYLIMDYKKQIDNALVALSYDKPDEIDLATLPTVDINAHTYPANNGLGNIIAFNVQLFMFDYQITKTLISTLTLGQSGDRVSIGVNTDSAINSLRKDPNISIDFTMALLEFLGMVTPSTRPIDQAYDPLLINLTTGMELFAVAHEYGHVLKKHSSPTAALPLGLNAEGKPLNEKTVLAYARSWKQELEADQVGIALVLQALGTSATNNEVDRLSWLYRVKGALYFFRCLDIVDQAKYILEHGAKLPPQRLPRGCS